MKKSGNIATSATDEFDTNSGFGKAWEYDALMNAGARDSMKSAISGAPAQEEPAQEEPTQETME